MISHDSVYRHTWQYHARWLLPRVGGVQKASEHASDRNFPEQIQFVKQVSSPQDNR
jgi:hypothetical protein